MRYDVCVFGGCALDQMYYQNSDGSYNKEPSMKVPGGKGANQAVASARAGAKTTIISRIGKDEIGKSILENLNFNLVDTSHIEMVDELQNDCANVYINLKDKDNDIQRISGAIDSFTPDMIEEYKEVLLNSKVIVCQLKVPKEVTEALIEFCHKYNKFLILTPCRPAKLSINEANNKELIEKIDIITCNRSECETIFNTDDIESCIKKYPNKLIVTLGKEGLMYSNGERIIHMPAIDTEVIDTVGAGDTLCGNLAAFISMGIDLQHSLRRAMYASAIKLQEKTAQTGMPYSDDLDDFIITKRNKNFNYGDELSFALGIIKEAYMNSKSINSYNISIKPNHTLVTDADVEIENYLINKLKERYTNDNFLTEENNPDGKLIDRTWIIDPIDGTSHFIKNTIFWGTQLAFYDKDKVKFAIIYLPKTDELYYAAENQGAFINNNKVLPKEKVPIEQTIVEFGGSVFKELESKKVFFNKLLEKDRLKVANIMHINSCCISFSNLISNKTDALIIASNKPWDVMPGQFILKEIGIKSYVLDFKEKLKLFTNNEEIKDLLLS